MSRCGVDPLSMGYPADLESHTSGLDRARTPSGVGSAEFGAITDVDLPDLGMAWGEPDRAASDAVERASVCCGGVRLGQDEYALVFARPRGVLCEAPPSVDDGRYEEKCPQIGLASVGHLIGEMVACAIYFEGYFWAHGWLSLRRGLLVGRCLGCGGMARGTAEEDQRAGRSERGASKPRNGSFHGVSLGSRLP